MENIETERSGLLSGIRTSGLKMFARISDGTTYILDRGEDAPDALEVRSVDGEILVNRVNVQSIVFDNRSRYEPIDVTRPRNGGD
jgi:hypothetical protein